MDSIEISEQEALVLYEAVKNYEMGGRAVVACNEFHDERITKQFVVQYYTAMFDEDKGPVEPPENFFVIIDCYALTANKLKASAYFTVHTAKPAAFISNVVIDNLVFDQTYDDDYNRALCLCAITSWVNKFYKGYTKVVINYPLTNVTASVIAPEAACATVTNVNKSMNFRAAKFKYHEPSPIEQDAEDYSYEQSGAVNRYSLINLETAKKLYMPPENVNEDPVSAKLFEEFYKLYQPLKQLDDLSTLGLPYIAVAQIIFENLRRHRDMCNIDTWVLIDRPTSNLDSQDVMPRGIIFVSKDKNRLTIREMSINLNTDPYLHEFIVRTLDALYQPSELYLNSTSLRLKNKYLINHFALEKAFFSQSIRTIGNKTSDTKEETESDDKPSLQGREG